MWLSGLIAVIVGYFLGNLNGAIVTSKFLNDDVRSHGSGNAGLTNFIRSYGTGRALLVILVDAGKALIGCMIGSMLLSKFGLSKEGAALGGAGVFLGHVFPVFLGFKGGKGILSGLFIALMVDWRIAALILAVFAIAYFITWYVSLGSVLAAVAFGVGFVLWHWQQPVVMICGIVMSVLAVFMHRENIARLIKGQERKTNLFQKKS